jgi:hypothetical protein
MKKGGRRQTFSFSLYKLFERAANWESDKASPRMSSLRFRSFRAETVAVFEIERPEDKAF